MCPRDIEKKIVTIEKIQFPTEYQLSLTTSKHKLKSRNRINLSSRDILHQSDCTDMPNFVFRPKRPSFTSQMYSVCLQDFQPTLYDCKEPGKVGTNKEAVYMSNH